MPQLFANNAQGTLASSANPSDTTLTLATGTGASFPSPTGGDFLRLTLTEPGAESSWEVVTCTARSGDVLTVTRAQEGTTAATWAAGSKVELRLTAGVVWPLESSVSGNLPVANLTTVNGNVGSFGSSTQIPTFAVNEKGLITEAGTTPVTDQAVPYYIPLGDTYMVAENKQALFRMPITVAGNLSVSGYLIEV